MTLTTAARALALSQSGEDCFDALEPEAQEALRENVRDVLQAIREPSEAMVAAVVQAVGDPSPDNWALAERVAARLGGPQMEGTMVCAELTRDWHAMIDAALAE